MQKVKYKNQNIITYLLSFRIIVLLSNIIFQGIRYMSFGEKIYKIYFSLILAGLLNILINNIVISLIIGHMINYILNGQFYVLFRYLSNKRTMSRNALIEFISIIENYTRLFSPLDILVTGSFCRGKMTKSSDLDIRIYHKGDLISSLKAYTMATTLRFIGLFSKFPIDIYCFSDLTFLDKLNEIEIPVNFLENKYFLKKYPLSVNYKIQLEKLVIE
tara:strand:- start:12443 stop:13093 length:651 start_codon:yes stop_codon:yes gene_type:complete